MEDLALLACLAFISAYLLLLSYCAKELLYALLVIVAVVVVLDGCKLKEHSTNLPQTSVEVLTDEDLN